MAKVSAKKAPSKSNVKAKPAKLAKASKPTKPVKAVKAVPPKPVLKKIEVKPSPKTLAATKESKEVKAVEPKNLKVEKVKAPEGASEELKKWYDFKNKHGAEKALPYNMSAVFEANKPIEHKMMGWGWIVNIQNDRLEVLFEQGIKYLISNYKPR